MAANYGHPMNNEAGKNKWQTAAEIILVCLAVALAIVLRVPLLRNAESLMTSDSAFNALSVRHLLNGDAFFLYYPGQDYQGITEGLIGVLLTRFFGWSALTYSCTPLLFYLAFLIMIYLLTRDAFGIGTAVKSLFLATILPGFMVRYSLIAAGGHMFVPLAGALLVWFLFRYMSTGRPAWLYAIGFLTGFSYYTYKLSVVVIAPVIVCLVYHSDLLPGLLRSVWSRYAAPAGSRTWVLRLLDVLIAAALLIVVWAFFFGSFRIIIGPVKIGAGDLYRGLARAGAWILVRLLLSWPQWKPWLAARGRRLTFFFASILLGLMPVIAAYALCPPNAQTKPIQLAKSDQRGDNLKMLREEALPELLGYATPPASAKELAGYTAARVSSKMLGAVYGLIVLYTVLRVLRRDGKTLVFARQNGLSREAVLLIFLVTPAAAYVFSNYVRDVSSHRYLIPVFVALPPLMAFASQRISAYVRQRVGIPASGGVLVLAICAATLVCNVSYYRWDGCIAKTGFQIQKQRVVARDVIEYLSGRGITRAYGTYWTCYLMTFLADEKMIVAPFQARDERKPPDYAQVVRFASNPPCIFPGIDAGRRDAFEKDLRQSGIPWDCRKFPGSMLGLYVYHLGTNVVAHP